jgi:hypothetical protein
MMRVESQAGYRMLWREVFFIPAEEGLTIQYYLLKLWGLCKEKELREDGNVSKQRNDLKVCPA